MTTIPGVPTTIPTTSPPWPTPPGGSPVTGPMGSGPHDGPFGTPPPAPAGDGKTRNGGEDYGPRGNEGNGTGTGGTGGGGTGTGGGGITDEQQNALNVIRGMNPWIDQIGIGDLLQQWVIQFGNNIDAIIGALRQSQQYKDALPGIFRPDGSMRMNEAQYFSTRDNYRQLLQQYGYGVDNYQPKDYAAFFTQDLDPNELKTRLETYDQVTKGPSDVRDAFYVYGGMKLSDEDMYLMTSDPVRRQQLIDEYNARVTKSPLDYNTWVTRATEAGLDRVVSQLTTLQAQGVATGGALDAVRNLSPEFAQSMVDTLYHGTDASRLLSLNELMHAFDFALIGGAATANGLALPDAQRVEALRQAGIDRARALEGYGTFATDRNAIAGAVQRAGRGSGFTQDDFEQAVFLHSTTQQQVLDQAQAAEKALGESSGSSNFSVGTGGRIQQRGLGLPI